MTEEDRTAIAAMLAAAEGRIVQAIGAAVQAEIKASEARTNARIEETETKLLTEFRRWASPNEARQRTHSAAIRAIDAELEYISDRVSKLEGKQPQ
jgi:hypothetical protein